VEGKVGFFDFLKLKNKQVETVMTESVKTLQSMPTVQVSKENYDCYDKVFASEMETVIGISYTEKTEIHKFIKSREDGFINFGGYFNQIWDRYFKDKEWTWLEFDEWHQVFNELGRYPVGFSSFVGLKLDSVEDALNSLKVLDLKEIATLQKVELPSKVKKCDLIDVLKELPNIKNLSIVESQIKSLEQKKKHLIYTLLMRTICFRANELHRANQRKASGVKNVKILYGFEQDKEFVDLALCRKPDAIPPFFPSDKSSIRAILDF
jgi:hypothetical protein